MPGTDEDSQHLALLAGHRQCLAKEANAKMREAYPDV